MAFNIFEKVWNAEGTPSFGAYSKENEDEAYGLFHQKCATNRNNKNCPKYLVMMFADDGATYATEARVKPAPEEE